VIFRLTWQQRLIALVLPALPTGVLILIVFRVRFDAFLVTVVAVELVVLGWVSWRLTRVGVDLDEHQAVVRGLLTRRVAWDTVQAVVAEKALGERRIALVTPGRRYRLSAPAAGLLSPDRDFDAKLDALRSWWLAHRSTDTPPPTIRQARSRTIREWVQLVASALLVAYATVVLLVVLVTWGRGTITFVPAVLLAVVGTCLLYPTRPSIARALRRRRRGTDPPPHQPDHADPGQG
jgi:hypothetical protein